MADAVHMLRSSHGLILAVLGLLIVATVMVNSASLSLSGAHPTTTDGIFLGKHTWFAVGAFLALIVGSLVPVDRLGATGARWWTTPVTWVAAAIFVSLALVHVPGIGREVNGARRWISIGPIGLQPSEIAKWGVPIIVAWYAVQQQARLRTFKWGFAIPLGAVSVLCGLIALEDLGTAVLIEVVSVAVLLAAGARWAFVAAMAPVGLLAFVALIVTSPYRINRIAAFLNPYKDPQGIGYHIIQSMEAISHLLMQVSSASLVQFAISVATPSSTSSQASRTRATSSSTSTTPSAMACSCRRLAWPPRPGSLTLLASPPPATPWMTAS